MIKRSLEYLTDELAFGLGIESSFVNLNSPNKSQEDTAHGIVISLLNVGEDRTLKNPPHGIRKNNHLHIKDPIVSLNLNTLIAFTFEDYSTSLQWLDETLSFFQSMSIFCRETERGENPFPADVERMILELQHLDFEHLIHFRSISGGTDFLHLMYRVRLVMIQPAE